MNRERLEKPVKPVHLPDQNSATLEAARASTAASNAAYAVEFEAKQRQIEQLPSIA